jgi:hypothetical protein
LATKNGPELLRLLTQCIEAERQCFEALSGTPMDDAAAVLHALTDPVCVRSTGIEALMRLTIMSQVFMSEQERLLVETAIAYYRDFGR